MESEQVATLDAEALRRETMGAFAHEIRTPLTSIRMVIELARRASGSVGGLVLDDELAEMLLTSVDDLQRLADDLQEMSRLERGKLTLAPGPCDLRAAVAAAGELIGRQVELVCGSLPGVEGPWDAGRLVRALAGLAAAANRMGDGTGSVRLEARETPGLVTLALESGRPGGQPVPVAADAGFAFFRSRQLVVAMGGSVHCERRERFARVVIELPVR